MANKIHLGSRVSVKQTITLKGTLKLASLGASCAGLICLLLFITFNSDTKNVKAGNQSIKADTSKFMRKSLFDVSDSLLAKYNNKIQATDSVFNLKEQHLVGKKQKKADKSKRKEENETAFQDFINIYPKNTSGAFNIEFQLPGKESFIPRIELLDRKGKVIETKIATPENGKIIESFIMNKELPNGPYLVKIYLNKELFVRQVVLQKELM